MSSIKLTLAETGSSEFAQQELVGPESREPPGLELAKTVPRGALKPELTLTGELPDEAKDLAQSEVLSPEVEARAAQIAQEIDLWQNTAFLWFGEEAQRELKKLTDGTLKTAMRRDTGKIGELLTEMCTLVKDFDKDTTGGSGFLRFTKKPKTLREKYDQTLKTIERVAKELEGQRLGLMVDIKTLDRIYQLLLTSDSNISAYIAAGQIKLAEGSKTLKELQQRADAGRRQEDILKYNDFQERTDRFEERVQDLVLSRTIGSQLLVQVQLSLRLNRRLAQRIQSSINNAIPAWKQSVAAALTVKDCGEELKMSNTTLIAAVDETIAVQQKCQQAELGTLTNGGE